MKTACAIPVFGRLPLVKQTVNRLKFKNKIDYIVCVCSTPEDLEFCSSLPSDTLFCVNSPLSQKWNLGFRYLLNTYNPDYYLFCGSSDWIEDDYMKKAIEQMEDFDAIGKLDTHFFDYAQEGSRLVHWPGYIGDRQGDSIGIGRILNRNIINKMQGEPFRSDLESGLDFSMSCKITMLGGKMKILPADNLISLSVSTHHWGNKHQFHQHWQNILPSEKMFVNPFMDNFFPEHKLLNSPNVFPERNPLARM